MRATFSIVNGNRFSRGSNILLKRYCNRFFSSVNIALSFLTSSEDESSLPDSTTDHPTNSECLSSEWTKGSYHESFVNHGCRFPGSSASKCVESNNDEMERMKSILAHHGWNFGYLNCRHVNLHEESIVKALNILFDESGSAVLSIYFFEWSEFNLGLKHTVRSVCALIHILVQGNMNHRVVGLLTCIVHGHPQGVQAEELMELLQEVGSRRVLETVYSMLVDCYTKEKMIDEAFQAICLMEKLDIFPSAETCNSLIKSLLKSNQAELAWDLLEEMHGKSLVCAITISLFISYYCSKGNFKSAWKLVCDMSSFGIKPDIVAYTILIRFLCELSYLKEASCLVSKIIQLGISPDSVFLSSIVHGYCEARRPGDAICIIKLFNVCPDVFVYNSFISMLCKEGDMKRASTVFYEMLEFGILPDCFIYTTMISGYCKASNRRRALQYWGKMLKDGTKPSVTTYTVLIKLYCRSGDMEIAHHLLQMMTSKGLKPDIVVYNTLIDGYKNEGRLEKAFELLGRMNSTGPSPDIVTYNTILQGLIAGEFLDEADEFMAELIRKGLSPDVVTFTTVIGGYSNKGLFEKAFLMWSYMSHHNVKPDVFTCSVLLNGYCRACRMYEAHALFHKMLSAGLTPDLTLYNTLIHGFCRLGNIEEACRVINMMVENSIRPNDSTYKALILGYEKKGMDNPTASALHKMQLILQMQGIDVD